MKKILYLLAVASVATFKIHATTFTIDSLDGDITANELKQFTNSIKTITPPVNNYNDAMSTHGTEVEGMRRVYEATGDMNVLNRLIFVLDIALVHRNDEPLGEHRVMWTGKVEPGWPENATNTTPACSSGQIHGNIACCAMLILETPSIWDLTVPDGNPYGYGVTYKQRALTYLSKVDQGLGQYITVWFVDPNTFRIHTPSDPRWKPASNNDVAETAWNRQALFVMAYQYAAECHDILGDNPGFLPLYKGVVNAWSTWFTTAYPNGGSVYYTSGGHNVAKWYYNVPTDQHIENQGHAQHDMLGLYQNWESGYTGLTSSQMKVYADTTRFVINLGSTNSWADNVDGTGSSTYLKTDFIWLSQWNPALFKMIAQADINSSQLNTDEGCKNTGSILWMKHWFFMQQAQDFTISATPSSRSTTPGGSVTYTINLAAINGFSGSIGLTVGGLPSGATASFSPASVSGSGASTLTVTTSSSTPAGSSTLTITGNSGGKVHTTSVSLVLSDFTISATPSSQSVVQGNSATYTVNLGSVNGFNSAVNLGVSGLPAGATATFNPASVTPAGSATLTVTTSASTPVGTSTLTITGISGSLSHSTSVSLSVTAPPDFTLAATPSAQTVTAGNGTTFTATIGALNGFNGAVSLSASGLPAGATAAFNPASVTGAGSSTFSIATSASTPAGTYTITVTGTSGSLTHSSTVTLIVNAAVITWTTVNDTAAGITYSAGWSYSTNRTFGDINSDVHYTKTNANYVQFTFTGTAIRYITETYTDEGNVDVYIDGVLQTTVSCNSATRQAQVVVYQNTSLASGSHTIKLVKSTGTYMLLDAFAWGH